MCACVHICVISEVFIVTKTKKRNIYPYLCKMVGTERKYERKHVLTRQVMVKAKSNRKRKGKNEKKRSKKD